jgi:hypothetical protein
LTDLLGTGLYRPPNWGFQPQEYSLTCTLPANTGAPGSNGSLGSTLSTATSAAPSLGPTTYFFDAVLRAEHSQEAIGTRHPVQIGPAIIDHIYLQPARVILEVAMSDAMDSFVSGQYSSTPSKSVSAYQIFKQIQAARVPIILSTRLDTYQNMWIADVRGTEDPRTKQGFRGMLYFEQIISATVAVTNTSARPDQTDSTNEGTKSTSPATPADGSQIQNMPAPSKNSGLVGVTG